MKHFYAIMIGWSPFLACSGIWYFLGGYVLLGLLAVLVWSFFSYGLGRAILSELQQNSKVDAGAGYWFPCVVHADTASRTSEPHISSAA